MFDSNVWDALLLDPKKVAVLETLAHQGSIAIFTTSIQEIENSRAPLNNEFEQIKQRLLVQNVASEGVVLDYARWDVDKFGPEESKWVTTGGSSNRDEVIAETAEMHDAWLVTHDKDLIKKARGLALPVYMLDELITALSEC
jgi:predicted nucleic acid-binding protein